MADVLAWSSWAPVNRAVALGRQMRAACYLAEVRRAEYERRCGRPLPPEGTRERRWALANRSAFLADLVEPSEAEAAALTERWARAEDIVTNGLRDGRIGPEVAEAADLAVWGELP